jgi:hypothetical protein
MKLIYNQSNLISIFPKTISCLFFLLLLTQPSIANSNNFYSGDVGRFSAQVKNCEVKVIWNTVTEENIKLFQLQWSGDGQTFHAIHTEFSSGSSPSNAQYIFLDENASFSNFYRLKTIYLDGTFKFTKTVLAKKECKINNTLTVFPNPVSANSNILNLEFIPTKSQAQILINDMLGRTIQRINYDVEAGIENKFELDISNYPAGTYNMIVVGEQQAKIFVIK